jgi:peptidoglycan/LPS O-acetylase OafA/YrhL
LNGSSKQRLTELDGLRALAVLLVIWDHTTRIDLGIGGYHGVLLFFVISGFLITGILLGVRGQAAPRQILRAFVIRRMLRIFPVYYVALLFAFLLGIEGARTSTGWHLAYLSNWYFVFRSGFGGPLSHLWSLSVEEQFYLLWPWFALFLPSRLLGWAIALMIASGPLSRLLISTAGVNGPAVYIATPVVLDGLGLGCLLAYVSSRPKLAGRVANWALVSGVLFIGLQLIQKRIGMPTALQFAIDRLGWRIVCVWIVYRASQGLGDGPVGRFLRFRPLVYIGTISYGIYLIHNFVLPTFWIIERHYHVHLPIPHRPGVWHFFLVAGLSTIAASVSWVALERPLNRLKDRFPYVPRRRSADETREPAKNEEIGTDVVSVRS